MIKEFVAFLKEYKVVGLAIAFIMGAASNTLMKSLVDNIIMPLMEPLFVSGSWQTATLSFGSVSLNIGAFVADALYFVVMAFVVFMVAKKILKEESVSKK